MDDLDDILTTFHARADALRVDLADVRAWVRARYPAARIRLVGQVRCPATELRASVAHVESPEAWPEVEAALVALGYVLEPAEPTPSYADAGPEQLAARSHHREMEGYGRVQEAMGG